MANGLESISRIARRTGARGASRACPSTRRPSPPTSRVAARPPASTASAVHAEDLYLACAGLLGDEHRGGEAPPHSPARRDRRICATSTSRTAFVDEVEQRLWDAALVGSATAPAKLATYTGHGALAGWVGIVAQRIALTHAPPRERGRARGRRRRSRGRAVRARPGAGVHQGTDADRFSARAVAGARDAGRSRADDLPASPHRRPDRRDHRAACTQSATRPCRGGWRRRARASSQAAQRFLREEAGLSPAEFDSVAALVMSQLDLSVSRIFKTGPG